MYTIDAKKPVLCYDLFILVLRGRRYLYANGLTPEPITELFVRYRDMHGSETRQRSDPRLMKLKYAISSFQCLGPAYPCHQGSNLFYYP